MVALSKMQCHASCGCDTVPQQKFKDKLNATMKVAISFGMQFVIQLYNL